MNVTFPAYTCVGAELSCTNRGDRFVGCRENAFPGEMQSAEVTCDSPSTGEAFQKKIISGGIGAVAGYGIGYAVTGDKGRALKAAAMTGALGLMLGWFT